MNTSKKITIVWTILFVYVFSAYAADTIIQNISWGQSSDTISSYGNRVMTIEDADLRFINKDADANIIWDFFSGYYYDPAYGVFWIDTRPAYRVRISEEINNTVCNTGYKAYKLSGYSYNPDFGFVDFAFDTNTYSYICLPLDETDSNLEAYIGGSMYSPYIGIQSLSGIKFDSSVDINTDESDETDDNIEGRFIKVDGIVASEKNTELLADQFDNEVRILGQLTKSSFRKDIHQKVYPVISKLNVGILPDPYMIPSWHLGDTDWSSNTVWEKILNNTVLYFQDTEIRLGWQNDINGNKTLVVEWANVYIAGNIRNSDDDGILGIIALQKDGVWWNIYIDPSVTDIHAVMYADRSLISYNWSELDGGTPASNLANQLYIRGSVFSENTIWASQNTPPECPYYVDTSDCNTQNQAMKYDLNFLRKYILVQTVDIDGNPVWPKIPQNSGLESFLGDNLNTNTEVQKSWYRKYPVIIEYDPQIQQTPPPFFN